MLITEGDANGQTLAAALGMGGSRRLFAFWSAPGVGNRLLLLTLTWVKSARKKE